MKSLYVMNLKRRADRLETFMQYNDKIIKDINVFDAVDGNLIDMNELYRNNTIVGTLTRMNKYVVGNALSQRALWEKCIEIDEPIIVCEDDAVLREDFEEEYERIVSHLPDDWEFLYLGYNFDTIFSIEFLPGIEHMAGTFSNNFFTPEKLREFQKLRIPCHPYPLRRCYGVPCYSISPRGAKKLIDLCFPLRETSHYIEEFRRMITTYTLDIIIMNHVKELEIFATFPPLAVTPNDKSDSEPTPNG